MQTIIKIINNTAGYTLKKPMWFQVSFWFGVGVVTFNILFTPILYAIFTGQGGSGLLVCSKGLGFILHSIYNLPGAIVFIVMRNLFEALGMHSAILSTLDFFVTTCTLYPLLTIFTVFSVMYVGTKLVRIFRVRR